jgi:tetratricopeptide (TPR) repeat protein
MSFYLLQKSLAAHQRGDLVQAEGGYRELLALHPDHVDALTLLGTLLASRGHFDEALAVSSRAVALDPETPLLRLNLGNVYMAREDYSSAVDCFREAVRLAPVLAEAHYDLGNALRLGGQWEEAGQAYRETLRLMPAHGLARNNLALVYEHEEKFDLALAELQSLLKDAPDFAEGWLNLCKVAEKAEAYETGLDAGLRAVGLMQTNPQAWLGLGVILNRLGRDGQAIEAYQNALRLKPDWPEVWDNLGQTYQALARLDEAEKAFRACIEAAGQTLKDEDSRIVDEEAYGNRHWHLALLELLKGDYKRGFARYRARFKDVGGLKRPSYPVPVWKGEDVRGKSILVTDEQGMGDCLMLLRYLPLLKERGAKVALYVQKPLIPLLQGWDGVDEVIARGDTLSGYDLHASIFDLPFAFKTTLESVPSRTPYLPVLAPDERTRLELDPAKPHAAIVWAGAPKHKQDAKRTLPLALLKPLLMRPDVHFFSLNRDKREGDDEVLAALGIADLAPRLNDFADAARYMAQMDLVISCDTATAHLAGATGRPVWTLLPFSPDWRWLLDREDSPWYPTMRLFRQKTPGDWDGVIKQVGDALDQWLVMKK